MNWYKTNQQQLLFYPYSGRPIDQSLRPPADPSGQYRCKSCGKPLNEDEVANWYTPDDAVNRQFEHSSFNGERVKQMLQPLLDSFRPYVDEFNKAKREAMYDRFIAGQWEIQANNLKTLVDQLRQDRDVLDFINMSATIDRWYLSWGKFLGIFNGEMSGDDIQQLSNANLDEEIQRIVKMYSKFSIKEQAAICQECLGDLPTCDYCNESILDDDTSTTTWGTLVCEKCIQNGNVSICDICGLAEAADDIVHVESTGQSVCRNCYQEEFSSSAWKDEIEDAITALNLPVGKNIPISDKAVNNISSFINDYAQKYGNAKLTEQEVGRLYHVSDKRGMSDEAKSFLQYLVNKSSTVSDIQDVIQGNIDARQYMSEQYPDLKNFRDIPVDIDIVDNYKAGAGFTIAINPNDELLEWGERIQPGVKKVWDMMQHTPHHPGSLAYARVGYSGGEMVINNLQRDADIDYLSENAKSDPKVREAAAWLDNQTQDWDAFLIHLISSIAKQMGKKAYLTGAETQFKKWTRAPKFKTEKSYGIVPKRMGFPQGYLSDASLLEDAHYNTPLWQVANSLSRIIKTSNWYIRAAIGKLLLDVRRALWSLRQYYDLDQFDQGQLRAALLEHDLIPQEYDPDRFVAMANLYLREPGVIEDQGAKTNPHTVTAQANQDTNIYYTFNGQQYGPAPASWETSPRPHYRVSHDDGRGPRILEIPPDQVLNSTPDMPHMQAGFASQQEQYEPGDQVKTYVGNATINKARSNKTYEATLHKRTGNQIVYLRTEHILGKI